MKKKVFVATLLFVLLSVAITFAYGSNQRQGNRHDGNPPNNRGDMQKNLFADIDTNSDEKISKDEFQNFHDNFFNLADQDKDEFMTKEEFSEAHRMKRDE